MLPHTLVGDFIDAVVQDQERAARLLGAHPELLNARWIHDETALHFLAIEGFLDGVTFWRSAARRSTRRTSSATRP